MATIKLTLTQVVGGVDCQMVFHYWAVGQFGTNANKLALMDRFETLVLPSINGIQSDQLDNVSLSAFAYDNPITVSQSVTGAGTVVSSIDATLPPQLAMLFKLNVGDTLSPDTGAPISTLRPVKAGKKFIPGVDESFSDLNGIDTAGGNAALISAAATALSLDLTGGGLSGTWYAVILGLPLAALPPSPSFPTGKPARDYCLATINTVTARDITKLRSRQS